MISAVFRMFLLSHKMTLCYFLILYVAQSYVYLFLFMYSLVYCFGDIPVLHMHYFAVFLCLKC